MNEDALHATIASLARINDRDLEALDLTGTDEALLADIRATPPAPDRQVLRPPWLSRISMSVRVAFAVGATALTVAFILILSGGSGSAPGGPEFAAAAVRTADANQRLLVTLPGWSVVRVGQFSPSNGELEFSDGQDSVQLTWYPADQYAGYRRDRLKDDANPQSTSLLGRQVETFDSGSDFATMIPPDGETFIELRAQVPEHVFDELRDSLQSTDANTWLAAMPASVVKPDARAAEVQQMLADIPLPPGFDSAALEHSADISGRYNLGAEVAGAVACEWVGRWQSATENGDTKEAKAAVAAMSTSRDWAVLREMKASGGYFSDGVWEYAAAIRTGKFVGAGGPVNVAEHPEDLPFKGGLGCRSNPEVTG